MTETIRTTGSAINDFFASIRNGWISFRAASRHRAEERRFVARSSAGWVQMTECVTKRQYEAQVKGFWANIDGIRNGFHENRSRIEDLESQFKGLVADFNGACRARLDDAAQMVEDRIRQPDGNPY